MIIYKVYFCFVFHFVLFFFKEKKNLNKNKNDDDDDDDDGISSPTQLGVCAVVYVMLNAYFLQQHHNIHNLRRKRPAAKCTRRAI